MHRSASPVPDVALNNGIDMPSLGFGVFLVTPDEVEAAVSTALESGYRLIDTAAAYRNEEGVGRAIAAAGLPREDLFVTTKLWNSDQGYDEAMRAFDASLERLGLDFLDLYLIHWPTPMRDRYVPSWKALEALYADGRVRAIGVSNFTEAHLDRLAAETRVVPVVNQVELHPWFAQAPLRRSLASRDIVAESWGPLGQGQGILDEPVITAIAARLGRTPAQVVLRWHLQIGCVVIPKSINPERIRENIDVFGFELTDDDLAAIAGLDQGRRLGPDPETFSVS
jgi:diketogulonate reductase-like aldo/keto reductase